MARKPRLFYPASFYHVMLRGNNGQRIFFESEDYLYFCSLIKDGVERFQHRIHAFCLMPNHVHILIETSHIPLAKVIQNIAFRYARKINKSRNQVGHLFQGRYKAILVDKDNYLITLCRYIHLNPLKANLVESLGDYRWSSHKAYLGLETLSWVTCDFILEQFSPRIVEARNSYQNFILSRDSNRMDDKLPLSVKSFERDYKVENISSAKEDAVVFFQQISLEAIIDNVCCKFRIPYTTLTSPSRKRQLVLARNLIVTMALKFQSATLTQIAVKLNRDIATVSEAFHKFSEKLNDSQVQLHYNEIETELRNQITEA